jgi:hypothetical protein
MIADARQRQRRELNIRAEGGRLDSAENLIELPRIMCADSKLKGCVRIQNRGRKVDVEWQRTTLNEARNAAFDSGIALPGQKEENEQDCRLHGIKRSERFRCSAKHNIEERLRVRFQRNREHPLYNERLVHIEAEYLQPRLRLPVQIR